LPENRSKEILKLMEVDEAADVRKLRTYNEDTAGGIMTTEFVAVPPDVTAEKAISLLREAWQEAETIFYVYVTDKKGKLEGVFSLKDLILAQPGTHVSDIMHRRIVSVKLTESQDKVAQVVAKYNLLAVPVIDNNRKLHGIVTADDALDKIIPTSWKKRLPRMYQ
jgi:Mg/Co/Ni transporter MgtE